MLSRFSQYLQNSRSGIRILLFLSVCVPIELATIACLRLLNWQGGSEGFLKIWPMVGALYGVTWLFQRLETVVETPGPLGPRIKRPLLLFGSGLVQGCLLILLVALCTRALGGFHWRLGTAGLYASILKAFPIWLVLAMMEEGIFRGYIFQKLIEGMGLRWTQLLCALLFALIHWNNRGMDNLIIRCISTLNLAMLAILFGQAWHHTRSLAFPIGLHVAWNWVQGSFLGFRVSGIPVTGHLEVVLHRKSVWLHGGPFGLEASLAATAVLALLLGFVIWKTPCGSPSHHRSPPSPLSHDTLRQLQHSCLALF